MERDYFVFDRSWYEALKRTPEVTRGRLYCAIVEFIFELKEPDLTDKREKKAWEILRPVILDTLDGMDKIDSLFDGLVKEDDE